jgi:ribosome-associated protein
MTLKKIIRLLTTSLDNLKAIDTKVLDVHKLSTITECMIIVSGRSNRQVRALATNLVKTAKDNNLTLLGLEGMQEGEWVLVDLGDVIVHIMQPATREYYQLEKLWSYGDVQLSVSPS